MNKKIKILIAIVLIAVIGVAGYFAYTSYASAEFDKNLKEAYGYYEARLDLFDEIDDITENKYFVYYNDKNSADSTERIIKKIDKVIDLIDKEINSLEKAKKFTQNPIEKDYIELLLKNKKNSKEGIKKLKEWYIINLDFTKGNIQLDTTKNKQKKIENDMKDIDNLNDKGFDNIREFLIKNPELKDKLKNLGFENAYIGEKP